MSEQSHVRMNLIADNEQMMFVAEVGKSLQGFLAPGNTARIMRIAENQDLALLIIDFLQIFEIHLVISILLHLQRIEDHLSAVALRSEAEWVINGWLDDDFLIRTGEDIHHESDTFYNTWNEANPLSLHIPLVVVMHFSKDVIALNDAGFEQISVEPVVLTPDSPYALRPDQLPMLKEQYEELGQEYIRRRAAGHFINFFHFNVDLEGGPCIRKRLSGCGSGDEYVAVTPEGDIYPCHQFVGREGYKMGSVLDGSFDTDIQKRFAANHVLNKEKCRSCWARFYCSGGCAANAQLLNGDISKPYDMECELERKRLECAIAVYAIERENRLRAKEQEEK